MNGIRRSVVFLILFLAALFAGCTTVPSAEFEAYKKAFEKARLSGEEVLLDYDVASSDYVEPEADTEDETDASHRFAFDFGMITDIEEPLDPVGDRMQAWEVLGRYNEALTAAAAGRSPEEISAAVDGLTGSLERFSNESISEVAADLVPSAGIAKAALEIIEREIAAQRFVESIQMVYPKINGFLDLLEADAQDFYEIRLDIHDLHYDEILDDIFDESGRFQALIESLKVPAEDDGGNTAKAFYSLVEEVNTVLADVPEFPSDGILVVSHTGKGPYTELAHGEFAEMKTQIKKLADQAKALDDELIAYRDVLIAYVKLIQQTRLSLGSVMKGIEEGCRSEVVAQNMFEAALKLRRAVAEYKKAR